MILRPPDKKKGTFISAVLASRGPVKTGDNDAPVVLAMPVMPAAAERSSGATTAIV